MNETTKPLKLNPRQQKFVDEYLISMNGTQAVIRAGYNPKNADVIASQNLGKLAIMTAIQKALQERAQRTEITADNVLRRWWAIATADPNTLVQNRRAPCRHCNGINNQFQWKTEREYREAVAKVLPDKAKVSKIKRPTKRISKAGGYGYSVKSPINPDCPECGGEGVGYVYAVDTRYLTPEQRILYAGAKHTKDGLEIKLQDQAKALENVARHLGMFIDKHEFSGTITLEALVSRAIAPPEIEGTATDEDS